MKSRFFTVVLLLASKLHKFFRRKAGYTDDIVVMFGYYLFLGDFLVCAGAIDRFVKDHPDRRISIVCMKKTEPIVRETGLFENIYTIEGGFLHTLRRIGKIKSRDMIVLPPNWKFGLNDEVLSMMIVSDSKYAARDCLFRYDEKAKKTFDKQYTRIIPVKKGTGFMEGCAEFFSEWTGKEMLPQVFDFKKTAKCTENAKSYYVVNLGASNLEKCWPVERFAHVMSRIGEVSGLMPVLVGGMAESGLVPELVKYYNGRFDDLTRKTSIRQLIDLFVNAAFYLGNDTGTLHLAACCGIPCFAPTSKASGDWFLPYPGNSVRESGPLPDAVFSETVGSCKGCQCTYEMTASRSCMECKQKTGKLECIFTISEEQIMEVIRIRGVLDNYAV